MNEEKDRIVAHLSAALSGAEAHEEPFFHLRMRDCFPPEEAGALHDHLPPPEAYKDLRHRDAMRGDGSSTRRHLILTGQSVAALPTREAAYWGPLREALASRHVRELMRRLHRPALERRFGVAWRALRMSPRISLIRDLAGYRIGIHRDIPQKVITTQFYLPADADRPHLGTVFYSRLAPAGDDEAKEGGYRRACQMAFLPNSGYSFTVGEDSHHGVDLLAEEDSPRHSLMLVYYLAE